MKVDGIPFKKVFDSAYETSNVMQTPRRTSNVINIEGTIPFTKELEVMAKNADAMAIMVGNLPLQGTKVFVIIAISLSLGESIILHPMTPAALHPKPMHMHE